MVVSSASLPGFEEYRTRGGLAIHRTIVDVPLEDAIEPVIDALDTHRGALLASSYEYPGRYTRWDMGFIDPPIQIVAAGRDFRIEALNERGRVLLPVITEVVRALPILEHLEQAQDDIHGTIIVPTERFPGRAAQSPAIDLLAATCGHRSALPAQPIRILGCMAPSVTTLHFNSSRCDCVWIGQTTNAIWCSICRTS